MEATVIRSAKDVIEVAKSRGFSIRIDEGPPPMPVLLRPSGVKKDEVTKALMDALKAWRLEIIEEMNSYKPVPA